jgi:alpha-beta hydrolase superfamily lysophospholipase
MGSFLGQRLVCENPSSVDAVILSASNGRPPPIAAVGRLLARAERRRLGPRGTSVLLEMLSFRDFNKHFRPNRTEFDWISRDEVEVDKYVADPMCGFSVSTQTWIDLLDSLGPLTAKHNLARLPKDLPIYLFAGDRDPVGDMGRGVERLCESYREAGLRDVELRLYPGGRHEMLHELNRRDVIDDVCSWLSRRLERIANANGG